jgi:hypothetical protein
VAYYALELSTEPKEVRIVERAAQRVSRGSRVFTKSGWSWRVQSTSRLLLSRSRINIHHKKVQGNVVLKYLSYRYKKLPELEWHHTLTFMGFSFRKRKCN